MREYLFRGKSIENGGWVYGNLIKRLNYDELSVKYCSIQEITSTSRYNSARVIPETVGEYTGLCDKNGNKIFEGDIVKFTDTTFGYSHIGEVCFDKGSFCILYEFYGQKELHRIGKTDKWQDMGASGTITYSYKVIGNIHDNPELLEVER